MCKMGAAQAGVEPVVVQSIGWKWRAFGSWVVLPTVRLFLIVCRFIYKYLFCPCPLAVANDLKPVYQSVKIRRGLKYGKHSRENCVAIEKSDIVSL